MRGVELLGVAAWHWYLAEGGGGRSTSLAELAIVCLEEAIVWLQLEHSMVTNEAIVWPQTGHSMAKGDHSMVILDTLLAIVWPTLAILWSTVAIL